MSAIAYITESKMLELHRLNRNQTMNFWRPSSNINFSDFGVGDLVFFLSKDKQHKKGSEKGAVGCGRVKEISCASIKVMWDRYGTDNGYNTYEEFKDVVKKVSKDKILPKKISAFYLEDVVFFQPVYLSECGYAISNKVESYVYLKPDQVIFNILEKAKTSGDLWNNYDELNNIIDKQEIIYALNITHKDIKDIKLNDKQQRKAKRVLKDIEGYDFIQNSCNEIYKIDNNILEIMFYNDKTIDDKLIIGQASLYDYYLKQIYHSEYDIRYKTNDDEINLNEIIKK